MSDDLSRPLDPVDAADRNLQLAGEVALSGMRRLVGMLEDDGGSVHAELCFRRDGGERVLVEGACRATVRLLCQRCLEPMDRDLEGRFQLQLMQDAGLPLLDGYEPLEIEAGIETASSWLKPTGLVEDELILAIPLAPVHASEDACGTVAGLVDERTEPVAGEGGGSPFAVLAALKTGGRSDEE